MKNPAIVDIAKLANVGKSTVSRVLTDPDTVSPKTRDKILEVMRELNFRPRRDKRRDAKNRINQVKPLVIAMLFPHGSHSHFSSPMNMQMLVGAEKVLTANKGLLVTMHMDAEGELPYALQNGDVDGVILRRQHEQRTYDRLVDWPSVSLYYDYDREKRRDHVQADDLKIGEIAAQWLVERNSESVLILESMGGDGKAVPANTAQLKSLKKSLTKSQIKSKTIKFLEYVMAKEVLESVVGALQVCSGKLGVYAAMNEQDLEPFCMMLSQSDLVLGQDIDVICSHNDETRLQMLAPRVACIKPMAQATGEAAAEVLLSRIKTPGLALQDKRIAPKLIVPSDGDLGH